MTPPSPPADPHVAFVGRCLRGPINTPVTVQDYASFRRIFGGLWTLSALPHAVEHFFAHGGRCAIIVRVVNNARPPTLELPCGHESLTLIATTPGSREFLRASVNYDDLPDDTTDRFNLVIQRVRRSQGTQVEQQTIYRRLSIRPGSQRFIGKVLRANALLQLSGTAPLIRPDATIGDLGKPSFIGSLRNGSDGLALTDYDVIGSITEQTGLFSLLSVERLDYVYIPPLQPDQPTSSCVLLAANQLCRHRHAMLIVDPPNGWDSADAALKGGKQYPFRSDHAVMFFPALIAEDRLTGVSRVFPNGGAVAGILARNEAKPSSWATHAGEPDASIIPSMQLCVELTEPQRWRLANVGINTLKPQQRVSFVRTVHRTLAGGQQPQADFGYLRARRFSQRLLCNLESITRWAVLGATTKSQWPSVWKRLRHQVHEHLRYLAVRGAFPEIDFGKQFFVICDERINPHAIQDDATLLLPPALDIGAVNIIIGFASWHTGQYQTYLISHTLTNTQSRAVALNRYQTEAEFAELEQTLKLAL